MRAVRLDLPFWVEDVTGRLYNVGHIEARRVLRDQTGSYVALGGKSRRLGVSGLYAAPRTDQPQSAISLCSHKYEAWSGAVETRRHYSQTLMAPRFSAGW
jgi:hypothetical protein